MKKDPITELHESAVKMAEFAASNSGSELKWNIDSNGHSTDNGHYVIRQTETHGGRKTGYNLYGKKKTIYGRNLITTASSINRAKEHAQNHYTHSKSGDLNQENAVKTSENRKAIQGIHQQASDLQKKLKGGNFAANSDAAHPVRLKYGANPRIKKFQTDKNGNMRVHVGEKTGGSVSIQTNGNLPFAHQNATSDVKNMKPDVHDRIMGEVHAHVAKHGTKRHKEILGHATGGGSSDFAAKGLGDAMGRKLALQKERSRHKVGDAYHLPGGWDEKGNEVRKDVTLHGLPKEGSANSIAHFKDKDGNSHYAPLHVAYRKGAKLPVGKKGASNYAALGYTHADMPQGSHRRNWTNSVAKLIKHHESMQHHKKKMVENPSKADAHNEKYQSHWDGWHETMGEMKKSHRGAGITPKMNDHIISQVASGKIKNHREAYAVATKKPDMNKGTGDNI